MATKKRYISLNDPPTVRLEIGKHYEIADYRGKPLPGTVELLSLAEKDYCLVLNNRGGHVHVKPGQFLREVS